MNENLDPSKDSFNNEELEIDKALNNPLGNMSAKVK